MATFLQNKQHKYTKNKNIKTKLYKNNAAIWYNETCRLQLPEVVLIQFVSPDDEHDVLGTCRAL